MKDEIATLTSDEYLANDELLEESGNYLFDDLFVVTSHADEVCGIATDFEIELN